jgi:hypothetical protein
MAEENQPPLKKARFKDNENKGFFVAPEHVELYKKFLAEHQNVIHDSSSGGPISPPGPSPNPGTSTEHIPSPLTDSESINGIALSN